MATTFVIQNQHGHYLNKQKEWADGSDRRVLFRCADKVDAINLVFEMSSKDIELRANYLECDMDDFGNPVVEASDIPLPMVETAESGEEAGADAPAASANEGEGSLESTAHSPNISS